MFPAVFAIFIHFPGDRACIKDYVFIDPPYNTGNDFVYEDDFAQRTEDYMGNSGQYDEEGNRIQQYQTDAVDAVARVFQGQPYNAGVSYLRDIGNLPSTPQQISVTQSYEDGTQVEFQDALDDSGFKNEALQLTDEQILRNIQSIQNESNIHQSTQLVAPLGRCSLDIEMETGTGKTYVYIKTMFELNKRYGWSKFIVVVPSIAIREGVKKSFEITADHFMECYGKKARFFIYNSGNLNQLDAFSSNSGINVMIINTQAFAASMNEDKNVEGRKGDAAARIIYTKRDEFGSRRPIDVIAANRPILILDEPQKMGKEDSATQKALKKFNPLFALNYSATHAKQHNLVYVLDALDAYNKRLVKKIEVKGFEVKNLRGTNKYLYLEDILVTPQKAPQAKIELEVAHNGGTKREFHKLNVGDTVDFNSDELISKAITHIDSELYVSQLQYAVSHAAQRDTLDADMVRSGDSFNAAQTRTKTLKHAVHGQVPYDLLGKIAEGTVLTRRTVAAILKGIKPSTFAMYQSNPEEFITKVTRLIKEQKATMIVEHITYDTIEGSYDSSIFTAEKHGLTMDKAYPAKKAIQDYVFTDGSAEKSVERKFAESLDGADEVFIYAKLPRGFFIPTPVGHYSPDWAIVFHEGAVKHIYFVAETKGTMESLNLCPIEKSKIDCAKKLFAKLSDGLVTYDHVSNYQELLNKVLK